MQTNPQKNNKVNRNIVFSVSTVVFAALVLFFYIVSNLPAISDWVKSIFSIFSPVIIGAAIAYLCNPILRFCERRLLYAIRSRYLRRMLGIILTYAFIILIIAAIALLLVPQLMDSITDLLAQYENYIANAVTFVNEFINSIVERFSSGENGTPQENLLSADSIIAAISKIISSGDKVFDFIVDNVTFYGTKLVSGLSTILLSLFISFYLLASKEKRLAQVKKLLAALFSPQRYQWICDTAMLADKTFGKYLAGALLDSLTVGIVSFIFLTIFNIPYAAMVSVIVGVTNVIPFFGPFIGAIPSAFIIFIADPSKTITFIIIILILQQIEGNIIAPKIIGNSTGVSSLCVITAISIMGNLWGVVGMIVGVPLFAVVTALIDQFANARLAAKGLPQELEEYYSLVDESEEAPRLARCRYSLAKLRYLITRGKRRGLPAPRRDDYLVYPILEDETPVKQPESATAEEQSAASMSDVQDAQNEK